MNVKVIKSAAQAWGHYDRPYYNKGDKKPDYYNLFDWSLVCGKIFIIVDGVERQVTQFEGLLKEELFNALDKKIAYLQGVFENSFEGFGVIRGENWLQFANSSLRVDRCKRWINEIAISMSGRKQEYDLVDVLVAGVTLHQACFVSIPNSHIIEINPAVVKFIQDYKFPGEEI